MPRAPLRGAGTLVVALALLPAAPPTPVAAITGLDPHMDPSLMRRGCGTCHRGHGASRSPMLPGSQRTLCLSCHGSRADREKAVRERFVSPVAAPRLLGPVLSQPYTHEVSRESFSAHEPGRVTCTSCHSPHRGSRDGGADAATAGRQRRSPQDPNRLEYELCERCHGSEGAATQSLTDISRLLNPGNPSYHPVEAPSRDGSPSVVSSLSGSEINCTDCHGNADPRGPRGPHGSSEPYILKARYTTVDGSPESRRAYALCYGCHRRQAVLRSSAFPDHGRHITDLQASCATCHSPHGSVVNRALVRFGEETLVAGVSPSASTGRLRFVSDGPGSGACFLTCHGRDHAPEAYGAMKLQLDPTSPLAPGPRTD